MSGLRHIALAAVAATGTAAEAGTGADIFVGACLAHAPDAAAVAQAYEVAGLRPGRDNRGVLKFHAKDLTGEVLPPDARDADRMVCSIRDGADVTDAGWSGLLAATGAAFQPLECESGILERCVAMREAEGGCETVTLARAKFRIDSYYRYTPGQECPHE